MNILTAKWPFPIENIQKPFLGILMLDTRFPRIKGDIGNPETFSFPVRKAIIQGAFPKNIVQQNPSLMLPKFIDKAKQLEAEGAFAITTSCGFLTLFQKELEDTLNIPVLTSSLFLFKDYQAQLSPKKRLGILTIAASSLSPKHLAAAGITHMPPIGTTENGEEFTAAILENREFMNLEKARNDNINAAMLLKKNNPDLGAILLECTNMPPYAGAIAKATGLPVYSIIDGLEDLWKAANKTA